MTLSPFLGDASFLTLSIIVLPRITTTYPSSGIVFPTLSVDVITSDRTTISMIFPSLLIPVLSFEYAGVRTVMAPGFGVVSTPEISKPSDFADTENGIRQSRNADIRISARIFFIAYTSEYFVSA